MYTCILAATDGSERGDKAVATGIKMAKALNAKLAVANVGVPYAPPVYAGEFVPAAVESPEEHEMRVRESANRILSQAREQAEAAGVACSVEFEFADSPYEALIALAEKRGCDLIVTSSHGRGGLSALLLGSETQKLLQHTKIDLLVTR